MRTSIQLSDDLRRRIKVLASYRDISYEELLSDLISVFQNAIPFQSREEFQRWFESNRKKFGFKKIIERGPDGDYIVENNQGKELKVHLELIPEDFLRRKHPKKDLDLLIVAYSSRKEIDGVRILPIVDASRHPKDVLKKIEGKSTEVLIPTPLFEKAKKRIKDSGFSSVSDYVTFMLREVIASHEEEHHFSPEDEEKVKERLRALGYLD